MATTSVTILERNGKAWCVYSVYFVCPVDRAANEQDSTTYYLIGRCR